MNNIKFKNLQVKKYLSVNRLIVNLSDHFNSVKLLIKALSKKRRNYFYLISNQYYNPVLISDISSNFEQKIDVICYKKDLLGSGGGDDKGWDLLSPRSVNVFDRFSGHIKGIKNKTLQGELIRLIKNLYEKDKNK